METIEAKLQHGMALHQQGRLGEAEKLYREVLQRSPKRSDALYLLGIIALATNKPQRAADLIERSIRQNPTFPPAHCNRGLALSALGRYADALASYDTAITLAPDFADAHYNRGVLLKDLSRPAEAVGSFETSLSLRPNDPEALNNLGCALKDLRCYEEALACFDKAIRLRPDFAAAYCNCGSVLSGLKRPSEALASYDRALTLQPDLAEAFCNRGDALHELKRPENALESFDHALTLQPKLAEAHFGKGLTLLITGRYAEGFRHHEWRTKRLHPEPVRSFPQPLWLGDKELSGKTLFIHPELFLGDMINFCRYAILAEQQGAKVILAARDPLRRLLASLSPTISIVKETDTPAHFDYHTPLMSLPFAFKTTIETVPSETPYLHPEPERSRIWRHRIGDHGFKIGICWQGSATSIDMDRTFPLGSFSHIARLPSVRLISLQTGPGVEQLVQFPEIEHFEEPPDGSLRPFVETAAMMANLDLVITSDTAFAHLAGALGRPTWVALKHVPDWRWGLEDDTTPWYPTARLFRQTTIGDWTNVFADIYQALVSLTE